MTVKQITRVSAKFSPEESIIDKINELLNSSSIDLNNVEFVIIDNTDDKHTITIEYVEERTNLYSEIVKICKDILMNQFNYTDEKWILKIDVDMENKVIDISVDGDYDSRYVPYYVKRENEIAEAIQEKTHFTVNFSIV